MQCPQLREAMEGARVRLHFEDKQLLSKSQRSQGLKRSWLLLTPDVKTISDLSSHLIHKFRLRHARPNALILSMDGYVLPAFESTCIFQDEDIIRVKRKDHMLKEITMIDGGANHIEDSAIFDKQPVVSNMKLLAIEGFDEDSQSEHDKPFGDALHLQKLLRESPTFEKKRKRSDKLESSRQKKARSTIPEKGQVVSVQYLKKDVQKSQNGIKNDKAGASRRVLHNKDMLSSVNGKERAATAPTITDSDENVDHSGSDERCVRLQEKRHESTDISHVLEEKRDESTDTSHVLEVKRKLPSRSARRKKAKRKWLRELKISQRKEATENCILEKDVQQESPVHQQIDPSTDVDDEVVPVVVRPGHIRFEPLGTGAGGNLQPQSQDPLVTIQWNGTTNKKKGQKWGKEKPSEPIKSNDASVRSYHEKSTEEEEVPAHDHVDFEKLVALRRIPKEGDMIAYRLIELSSSWSPELSSFRVGKISSYDSASKMVKLVSVPEYPVLSDKASDEEMQSSFLLYNEDGYLEISFESLVDVRIFNHGELESTTVVPCTTNEASVNTQEAEVAGVLHHNAEATAPVRENGRHIEGAWDEICQALSEKKAQLMKNNGWGTKESSGRASWSYKALRSSALGPTVALLRAQNNLPA